MLGAEDDDVSMSLDPAVPVIEADAEERALRLHRESLVVDSLGQISPGIRSEQTEQLIEELIERGLPLSGIADQVSRKTFARLADGQLPEFWEAWGQCGVTVSSVTMAGLEKVASRFENAVQDIADLQRVFDAEPRLRKILTAQDAHEAKRDGGVGLIINFQNTSHFGDSLRRLEVFYNLGVRVIQLTYNSRNLVGDGCTERNPSGLSGYGLEVVARMNELGILVDVSHCSRPTTLDAAEASTAPIAITHSFSRTVHEHDRGKFDEELRAVAESGGYIGVCAVPFFITADPEPTLDHWADHIDYICELVGPAHVGIGSDWGQVTSPKLAALVNEQMKTVGFRAEHGVEINAATAGYETYQQWPNFTRTLVARGYSDDEIRGFLGENFLRVFAAAVGS